MVILMSFNLKEHKLGDHNCRVGECEHLHGRWFTTCSYCSGVIHAIESDWSDYSYGHGGGRVFFETVCDSCGLIERDSNMKPRILSLSLPLPLDIPPLRFPNSDAFIAKK